MTAPAEIDAMPQLQGQLTAGPYSEINSRLIDTLTIELDEVTPADMAAMRKHRRDEQDHEQTEKHLRAQAEARRMWKAAIPCQNHRYLSSKGIQPHGTRLQGDLLLIPMRDRKNLWNLQRITPAGKKLFLKGGRTRGLWFSVGLDHPQRILVGEGVATMATLREKTGCAVVAAFSAGNLSRVTKAIRDLYPLSRLTVCADNDPTGLKNAREAADLPGVGLIRPDTPGADFNDERDDTAWNL